MKLRVYSVLAIIVCGNTYAFEKIYTHPALSQEAASASLAGTYLQTHFGYTLGLSTALHITDTSASFFQDVVDRGMTQSITTRSILGWMREGSKWGTLKLVLDPIEKAYYTSRVPIIPLWGVVTLIVGINIIWLVLMKICPTESLNVKIVLTLVLLTASAAVLSGFVVSEALGKAFA